MRGRVLLIIGLIVSLVLFLVVRSCQRPGSLPASPGTLLSEDDRARITVDKHVIVVKTDEGATTKYVPNNGSATVSVSKKGSVTLAVTNKGFSFDPVIGVFGATHLEPTLGLQLGYWNRWETYVGVKGPYWGAWGGIGYRLDQLTLDNTSVYVGYSTTKEIGAGILVRF